MNYLTGTTDNDVLTIDVFFKRYNPYKKGKKGTSQGEIKTEEKDLHPCTSFKKKKTSLYYSLKKK
jgi:hypothetical protein